MSHDPGKELQEASLIGRILSLEALLFVMGIASLVYGILNRIIVSICVGAALVAGVIAFNRIRRKEPARQYPETRE